MMRATVIGSFAALFLVACAAEDTSFPGGRGPNGSGNGVEDGTGDGTGNGENGGPGDPTQPGTCAEGVAHVGFGGQNFVADRQAGALGADRYRVKPFSALTTEYRRVLGANPPGSLTSAGAAFGDVPNRWFQETRANAVGLYTTYATAFTACYDSMADAKYGTAPSAATAEAECGALQRKAWLRTPTTEELGVCRDLAVTGLSTEANARRRWAHVCASVMTSAGFTSF